MGELGIELPSIPKEKKRKTYFHHFKELFCPAITTPEPPQHTHMHTCTPPPQLPAVSPSAIQTWGWRCGGKCGSGHGACWGRGWVCRVQHTSSFKTTIYPCTLLLTHVHTCSTQHDVTIGPNCRNIYQKTTTQLMLRFLFKMCCGQLALKLITSSEPVVLCL